jgi:hypothetical protein
MRLRPQAELDEALRDHVETTHYYDSETGALYAPSVPPPVVDPEGDEDSEVHQ